MTLTIYDQIGHVVRTLDVGHRIASAYESRSKAVYWDGNNGLGEGVASGIYFYTLTAGGLFRHTEDGDTEVKTQSYVHILLYPGAAIGSDTGFVRNNDRCSLPGTRQRNPEIQSKS